MVRIRRSHAKPGQPIDRSFSVDGSLPTKPRRAGSASVIAIVDDNRVVLESLSNVLASAGHVTRIFSSAREFLDSGALHSIGCLVSDLHLKGMDGWELRSVAHVQRPGLPVILITGDHEAVLEPRPLQPAGLLCLLFKPFGGQQLLAAAQRALQSV
jgi:FixJ family two-component response regulator